MRITRLHTPVALVLTLVLLAQAALPALAQTPAASPMASPVAPITPTFTEGICAYPLPEGFTAGDNATCGTVTAPMYPDRASNETVVLPIIWLHTTNPSTTLPPLFMLQGGPGQSLQAILATFSPDLPIYTSLLDQQDVILFDQRGMGKSTPNLACAFENPGPFNDDREGTPTPIAAPNPAVGFQYFGCGTYLREKGIDFTAFTTKSNAADINSIRQAMGFEQIDLYGISYGTRLALEAMRDYPETIRASVIASPLPLESNPLADQYLAFDRSLKQMYAACEDDPACNQANPNLERNLNLVANRLKTSPAIVTVFDPATGEPIYLPVDDVFFMNIIYLGMFVSIYTPYIPSLITTLANDDTSVLQMFATLLSGPGSGLSLGALATYWCQEEVSFAPQDVTNQQVTAGNIQPLLRSGSFTTNADLVYSLCQMWKLPETAPAVENEPAVSDVQTLIVTGRYDPITPVSNGEMLLSYLPNARMVVMESGAHDAISTNPTCGLPILTAFLADPTARLETACADIPMNFAPTEPLLGTPEASPVASPAA